MGSREGGEGSGRKVQGLPEGKEGVQGGWIVQDASDNCERNPGTMGVGAGPRALAPPRNRSRRALESHSEQHPASTAAGS